MKNALVCIAILFAGMCLGTEDAVKFERDIVYGKTGDVELKMDLARPSTGDGPFPGLVFIHGGGWAAGSKTSYDGTIKKFAEKGYVVTTVEYRFAPTFKFPAQIEDCKCAVRYMRAHAEDWHMNPEKMGAIGDSAGGHLSLMLGLMNKEDGLEGNGGCSDQSSKVQAVVNYYGPGDFTAATESVSPIGMMLVKNFLGTDDRAAPVVAQASPAHYIDKNDAPILTFHGSNDPLVPVAMSRQLHEALKKAGVEEKLEVLDGLGHGWGGKDREKTMKEALEFFDAHLKK